MINFRDEVTEENWCRTAAILELKMADNREGLDFGSVSKIDQMGQY